MPRINLSMLVVAVVFTAACGFAAPPVLSDNIAIQIALDRAGFSPGLIDGKMGAKTGLAICDFQRARGFPVTGHLDGTSLAALHVGPSLASCIINESDLKEVTGTTTDWVARSRMPYLGYESAADMIAEKFHTSRACLSALNPGVDLNQLKAGDSLTIPEVDSSAPTPRANRLEVNLAQKVIRAFDSNDHPVALFHCSIAKDVAKRPSGKAQVTAVAQNPTYTFDPAMWPEVKNVHQKLLIPSGPRNPVGLAWVSLSLPGYGMHGTPHPEQIGKTGSHGCFRLANWDAVRLSKMVRAGMSVSFVGDGSVAVAGAQ